MYLSHNKKIRIERRGSWYEIFLGASNAQHIVDRATDPSHQVSLEEVMELASKAYYVRRAPASKPEPHYTALGLIKFEGKFYEIVGYLTELWGGRFILKTCRVISDEKLRMWCNSNSDLLAVATRTADGHLKIIQPRKKQARA